MPLQPPKSASTTTASKRQFQPQEERLDHCKLPIIGRIFFLGWNRWAGEIFLPLKTTREPYRGTGKQLRSFPVPYRARTGKNPNREEPGSNREGNREGQKITRNSVKHCHAEAVFRSCGCSGCLDEGGGRPDEWPLQDDEAISRVVVMLIASLRGLRQ